MGMGEPLMNYNNVLKAIDKITSTEGLAMSPPRRITVSTSGVPKMIKKMADDEVRFKLAVSLHSAIDEVRTSIMPSTLLFPWLTCGKHSSIGMLKPVVELPMNM